MFNMRENAGDNAGYELRIKYNVSTGLYGVTAYLVFMDRNERHDYDRDGMTKFFDTMQDAINYIVNYEVK